MISSLTMTPGRIYGLRGKNGCGKTMLMRAICGLLIPDGGHIYIDDEELHRDIKFPRSIGALIEICHFCLSTQASGT